MSFLDKIKLTVTDFVKGAVMIITVTTAYFTDKMNDEKRYDELASLIKENAIYKTSDDKIVNSRIERLEASTENNNNKTNEIEKNIIRLMAIIPDYKLEIKRRN